MRTLSGTILLIAVVAVAAPADAFRPRAYSNYGSAVINDGATKTVASVTLPIGSYALSASVTTSEATGDGQPGLLTCVFITPGDIHQKLGLVETAADATMPVLGTVDIAVDNSPVVLECQASSHKMSAQAGLIATRVAKIITQ